MPRSQGRQGGPSQPRRVLGARARAPGSNRAQNPLKPHVSIRDYLGPQTAVCTHCKARHWECERTKSTGHFSTCCSQGKVRLSPPPQPNLEGSDSEAKAFRENSRSYNNALSFTSLATHFDQTRLSTLGPPVFRVFGRLYHRLGALIPAVNQRPAFAQTWLIDPAEATDTRLGPDSADSCIQRSTLTKLKSNLRKSRAGWDTAKDWILRLCLPPGRDRRTHTLPTSSTEMAMLICDSDTNTGDCGPQGLILQVHGDRCLNGRPEYKSWATLRQKTATKRMETRRKGTKRMMMVNVETDRLNYIQLHQENLRLTTTQGINGLTPDQIGRSMTLGSTFKNRPHITRRYQDAMACVVKHGKPPLLIMMTCDPESQAALGPNDKACNRPDLIAPFSSSPGPASDRIQHARPTNGEAAGGLHPPPVNHPQGSLGRYHRGRTSGAGGRRGPACQELFPLGRTFSTCPITVDSMRMSGEGLFTGRKCAEECPTPLPVTVDGHPGRLAHTILRDGDLCAVVCTVEGRAWRDRSSGKWHRRPTFVPLRIRVHGQNDMTRLTTPPPTVRLSPRWVIASPVKRSAMDAELETDVEHPTSKRRCGLLYSAPFVVTSPPPPEYAGYTSASLVEIVLALALHALLDIKPLDDKTVKDLFAENLKEQVSSSLPSSDSIPQPRRKRNWRKKHKSNSDGGHVPEASSLPADQKQPERKRRRIDSEGRNTYHGPSLPAHFQGKHNS
ncbi:BZ3500_MvSof-1268-A1-R1_Chr2-2g05132 [Microbotryum saponariae]|uniref:BZ3500_MvSof-1268-A1-R1_Chr2-2g05132 protein n=1 Tax=Microbotryum saponariae TaxID=289078 RepID=A0A2X0KAW2_9BASI|nr:BZ3500_MvSof-1268-A1-R1_Chr2-2g05132 [Microbotryum saponariae]SDA00959.1 BZ3501_MvSof-1269-A2-R1_Chr2-2g04806 [Microbotryum saponariae]